MYDYLMKSNAFDETVYVSTRMLHRYGAAMSAQRRGNFLN